jgi:hypothetical protein
MANEVDVQGLEKKITPEAIKAMTIIERFVSPSPKFFVSMQKAGLVLGTVSTAVALAHDFPGFVVPQILTTIAGYCAVAGYVMATVSKLPVQSNAPSEVKPNEVAPGDPGHTEPK